MHTRRVALRNVSNKTKKEALENHYMKNPSIKKNPQDENENSQHVHERDSSEKQNKDAVKLIIPKRKSLTNNVKRINIKDTKKTKAGVSRHISPIRNVKEPLQEKTNQHRVITPLIFKDRSPFQKLPDPACFVLTKDESSILEFIKIDQENDIGMESIYRENYIELFRREHFLFEQYLNECTSIQNSPKMIKKQAFAEKKMFFDNKSQIKDQFKKTNTFDNEEIIAKKNEIFRQFININYMMHQHDLTWLHRSILIDWITEISYNLSFLPETLYLSVFLVDRFLSLRLVTKSKLQLVGLTALFIAAKYEEVDSPSISTFTEMINTTTEELIKAEKYLLLTLEFNIEYLQPLDIIRTLSATNMYDMKVRVLSKYILEMTLIKESFLRFSSVIRAISAFYLAKKIVNDCRCPNLPFYIFRIEKSNIKECVNEMLWMIKESSEQSIDNNFPSRSQTEIKENRIFTSIKKKYSSKTNLNVSHFVDEFADKHLCKYGRKS